MAKAESVATEEYVAESAMTVGDLDLPDVELHPAGSTRKVTVTKAAITLSKSSSKPMLALTLRLDPEDYAFGYDPINAPEGIVVTEYVNGISFGLDEDAFNNAVKNKKHGLQGVTKLRNVFKVFHEPWAQLEFGPRADLAGHICLSDASVGRLVGKSCLANVEHEIDNRTNLPQVKFRNLAPLT